MQRGNRDGHREQFMATSAHGDQVARDANGIWVGKCDVERLDSGRNGGQNGRVHLSTAQTEIAQLRQLR